MSFNLQSSGYNPQQSTNVPNLQAQSNSSSWADTDPLLVPSAVALGYNYFPCSRQPWVFLMFWIALDHNPVSLPQGWSLDSSIVISPPEWCPILKAESCRSLPVLKSLLCAVVYRAELCFWCPFWQTKQGTNSLFGLRRPQPCYHLVFSPTLVIGDVRRNLDQEHYCHPQ